MARLYFALGQYWRFWRLERSVIVALDMAVWHWRMAGKYSDWIALGKKSGIHG